MTPNAIIIIIIIFLSLQSIIDMQHHFFTRPRAHKFFPTCLQRFCNPDLASEAARTKQSESQLTRDPDKPKYPDVLTMAMKYSGRYCVRKQGVSLSNADLSVGWYKLAAHQYKVPSN